MKYVVLLALAVALAPSAGAQPGSAYYGVALGTFDYDETGPAGGGISDTTDSYRLMVGYQFNEFLVVEGGLGKTGTISDTISLTGIPGAPTAIEFSSEFTIFTVRLLGVINFDSGITLLGGLGYADMKQDVTVNLPGFGSTSSDVTGNEPTLFAAVQYDWERVGLRLGYEKYDFDGGLDVAETSVAFFYKL